MARAAGANSKVWQPFGWPMAEYALLSYTGMRPTESAGRKSNVSGIWTEVMSKRTDCPPLFAVCVKNTYYPASLELYKIYRLLPDDEATRDGDVRVVDESGEDYLYPADYFVVIEIPKTVEQAILQQS